MLKISDIAKAANVSEATVSLALNNKSVVNEDTKKRIKKIAKELGYRPNAIARGLVKAKTNTIGVIVPDIANPYYARLIADIDKNVREAGYNMVMAISNDKPEVEKSIIENFISQRVDGVIMAPANCLNEDFSYVTALNDHEIPYIYASAYCPGDQAQYVMVDLEDGMYRLVKYLLDIGHREIFFIGGLPDVITTKLRINGYKRAFEEKGLEYTDDQFIQCKKINYDEAQEAAKTLLKSKKNIKAIVTISDFMAIAILNVLRQNGYTVPGDVSLAGYDNVIFSTVSSVPLTTVNQNITQMSDYAVNMILTKIQNKEAQLENVLIKPELIIRESTNTPGIF